MEDKLANLYIFVHSMADDVWKIHRKMLNYSFNLKILQTFIPTFIENSKKLVEDLSVNIDKTTEFDMLAYTTKSALNMICGKLENFFFYRETFINKKN
jgi:cytochrome P450